MTGPVLADNVKQQYQRLAVLLKNYRETPLASSHIQQTLSFCDILLKQAKEQPDPLFAQSQLHKPKIPFSLNIAFNTCLLTCLIGARNKLNDTTNQQLMCAAITLYAFEQEKFERHFQLLKTNIKLGLRQQRLCKALEKSHQDCWLSGYSSTTNVLQNAQIFNNAHSTESKEQIIVSLAAHIALLTTENKRYKKLSFAAALKFITLNCPSSWHDVIGPLLDYPSLTPPGSYIRLAEKKYAVVLAVAKKGHFIQELSSTEDAEQPAKLLLPEQLKISYAAQTVQRFSQFDLWWGERWQSQNNERADRTINPLLNAFEHSYKLDNPPAALLAIQAQLKLPEPDVQKLSEAISKEPTYAIHLQKTASLSTRLKLPVQDIQHGLMMHGFERSGSILMQQSLLSRLNQHYFPLQSQFIQFIQLRGHIAGCIAKEVSLSTQEQVCALTYFATAGLFTHPALKIQRHWITSPKRLFDVNQLVDMKANEQLQKHAVILAEAWQQSSEYVMALRNQHLTPEQMTKHKISASLAMILGLSLVLARQLYFGERSTCNETEQYTNSAAKRLNLPRKVLDNIQQQTFHFCHSYRPCTEQKIHSLVS